MIMEIDDQTKTGSPDDPMSQKLALLHSISRVLGYDLSMSEVLQHIVAVTAELMHSKICSILLYDEENEVLSIAATQSLSAAYRDKPNIALRKSVSGQAILSGKPQMISDVRQDDNYGFRSVAEQEGIVSLLCVPMMIRGQAIGTINSYSAEEHNYSDEEAKMLSLVAAQAAIAIENARLKTATDVLQREMEVRRTIAKAKKLLMTTRSMSEPQAYRYIQKQSMNTQKPMKDVAEAILLAGENPAV